MIASAALAAHSSAPLSLRRALEDANNLLLSAEAQAIVFQELGVIDLPPAERGNAMGLRAIASLYLASTLEAAGVIQAADDLTRLARTAAIDGDLGEAAPLLEEFWDERERRPSEEERLALFGKLFGAPAGPEDAMGGNNDAFEERLLDLCDALMKAADGGGQGRVRTAGVALAENVAAASNSMVEMLARTILETLAKAVGILNHSDVKAIMSARTMWDTVSGIDRRFRRPSRPILAHLRRGRAGMAVLAWLADRIDTIESSSGPLVTSTDLVIDAAIDWVDETLGLIRSEEESSSSGERPGPQSEVGWHDLGR